ncbi:DUF4282 domain-containing protein [bacterium]|nr:DUF4282 domain-containing protein [bacterium]
MRDFLTFRKFITPVIIQIIFWIGVVGSVIGGFVAMIQQGGIGGVFLGLVIIILGPIMIRIYCEILILIFRINDSLVDIRNNTSKTM